jgi:C-terminal processing protease CtpA/Prc
MIYKLTIAALLATFLPASALAPGDPQQHILVQDGFFSAKASYLGVDIRDITSDRVSVLKLKEERGVEITMVDQDSPAGKAGLKEHDVILEYNGTKVEGEEQLRRMIRETPPGRTVTLGISRDGAPMNISVQLADRGKMIADNLDKANRDRIQVYVPPHIEMPEINVPSFDVQISSYTPSLGIQVENLNQQLGEFFGVKGGEGVLVKSVEKGSAAEKAGMKAGDVIIRVNSEKITDRSDLRRVLRLQTEAGKATVGIVRDKRDQNLTIELPARKDKDSSGMELVLPDMSTFDDMHSELEDLGSQIRENALVIGPQIRLETAEMRKSFREAQKQWREHQKEWKKNLQNMKVFEFHDFI